MPPFMELPGLPPLPGGVKCIWVRRADGRLETVWVPDWDIEAEVPGLDAGAPVSG